MFDCQFGNSKNIKVIKQLRGTSPVSTSCEHSKDSSGTNKKEQKVGFARRKSSDGADILYIETAIKKQKILFQLAKT